MLFILANISVFSLEFIMIIIVLMMVVFALTYFIKRFLMNKYVQELELSTVVYKELHDDLLSDNWKLISDEINDQDEVKLEFNRIDTTLSGCYSLSNYLNDNTAKNYEIKEIVSILSYITDVIETERDNIKLLNQRIRDIVVRKDYEKLRSSENLNVPIEDLVKTQQKVEVQQAEIQQKDEITPEIEKCDRVEETVTMENNNTNNNFTSMTQTSDECSVFAKGLVIKGDVQLETPLVVKGTIQGNLTCGNDVEIDDNAVINGNINADSLTLSSGKVEGDVKITTKAYIGEDTFVKGNVNAQVLNINGSIEGDVVCEGEVAFSSDARVMGDITAAYIDINKGAKIIGNMRIGENTTDRNE